MHTSRLIPALLSLLGAAPAGGDEHPPRVTHGAAAAEVTSTSAIIWSRGSDEGYMYARISGRDSPYAVRVRAESDFTGQIEFTDLAPDKSYRYQVWFTRTVDGVPGEEVEGRFRTASEPDRKAGVSFVWSAGLGGQNVCRDRQRGYPVFAAMRRQKPDFVLALGDMIYADGICAALGRYGNEQLPGDFAPAASLEQFWRHWRYNRADPALVELLASTAYFGTWDDHEVVVDFGPQTDTRDVAPYVGGQHLLPLGRRAFLHYTPIATDAERPTLYRSIRWGRHVDLFILDTRSYRDPNGLPDTQQQPKTLLGLEQRRWLEDGLAASGASWKFVASSVPMAVPTGAPGADGRDGWADHGDQTGYERELVNILRHAMENDVGNLVWLSGDLHFATAFRHTPFPEVPSFQVYEFIAGPLQAGLFPNEAFDTTLRPERLFYHAPDGDVASFDGALRWFNFGRIEVDRSGSLMAQILTAEGDEVFELQLEPR